MTWTVKSMYQYKVQVAFYARERNPIVSLMAADSIAALGRALPRIASDPADREARGDALYGAWLGGACRRSPSPR